MNQFNVKNKRVFITGAGQGIGRELATQLAAQGANLILTDINEVSLKELVQELAIYGRKVETYVYDVSDRQQILQVAAEVQKSGGLDVLVNNAGIGHQAPILETSAEDWQKLWNINFWGPLNHIFALLPALKISGEAKVINVASGQAFIRLPTWVPYSVTKLAIGALSEGLDYELSPMGIQVQTVYPYLVNSKFYNNVESKTMTQKVVMKAMPYLSDEPSSVAGKIISAIKTGKRLEYVHFLNPIFKMLHVMDDAIFLIRKIASLFMLETGNGFRMTEDMRGSHKHIPGSSLKADGKFDFHVHWGTDDIVEWMNPNSENFMLNKLYGTVSIEGLGENIPCQGSLKLDYFGNQKIVYDFTFEHQGINWHYIAEKRNIYPWNLPVSHTTCYGILYNADSGEAVSNSITYFKFEDMAEFIASFQIAPTFPKELAAVQAKSQIKSA